MFELKRRFEEKKEMLQEITKTVSLNGTIIICRTYDSIGRISNSRGFFYNKNPLESDFPLLLVQLSIISLVTQVTHYFFSFCGQSTIVSQIVAGIILGPSFLGHDKWFRTTIFPSSSHNTLETIATFGLMLFFFLVGVKTDTSLIQQCGPKSIAIGLSTSSITLAVSISISMITSHIKGISRNLMSSLCTIGSLQCMTSITVMTCLLTDLKMLSTDVGRLAVGAALVCEMVGFFLVAAVFPLMTISTATELVSSYTTCLFMVAFIVFVLRPATHWIIRNTPEGKKVKDEYIYAVFVAILLIGHVSEVIGQHFVLLPLIFGLSVPDGPPLGAALVQKLDALVSVLLVPTYLTISGLKTDIFALDVQGTWILACVITTLFIIKILAAMLPCLYYNIPLQQSFVVGILMNGKGITELVPYNIWKDSQILDDQAFSLAVLTTILITAIVAPLVRLIYDPSEIYLSSQKYTIQYEKRDEELRILVCIHKQEDVPTIIKLIEVSHATEESPISLFVLELIQLAGRSTPILIYHQPRSTFFENSTNTDRIVNAFRYFEKQNRRVINLYPFTAISHQEIMHDDVCNVALDKRVNILIVPFHKKWAIDGEVESNNHAIRSMNRYILDKAPCSVGILVDRRVFSGIVSVITTQSFYRVAVLFMGGNDDREALAYATRMAEHDTVHVMVIRFFAFVASNAKERALDDDIINEFKRNNVRNKHAAFREELVKDAEGIAALSKEMGQHFDLILVGRRHEASQLLSGLDEWSECPELGVMGDLLASTDLKGMCSVLIVQQATISTRWKHNDCKSSAIHDIPLFDEEDTQKQDDTDDGPSWTVSMEGVIKK